MTDTLTTWIAHYRRAWESNEPADITALFTEDAEYRTEPYSEPWRGHNEIVDGWLEARDEPGEATFTWSPIVSTPELGIAEGITAYVASETTYSNLWVVRFAPDGRATHFTEWWMDHSDDEAEYEGVGDE
ncbi:MAG: hypothetical protein JWQ43_2927 [Glaciihabitans sp.]|nr:hypothetical protein [Glaciihabitans sp.]